MNKGYLPILTAVLVSVLFIALLYANSFTGYAPGNPDDNDDAAKNTAELNPELPDSILECSDSAGNEKCGGSCWLKDNNKPAAGNFKDAKGRIGALDWSGNCMEIAAFIDDKLCCNDCDCGSGICYEGECAEPEPVPVDAKMPLFTANTEQQKASSDFVKYLYSIRSSVRGTPNMCAEFVMLLMDRYYKNKEILGISGNAWDMAAAMMKKNTIICQYPNCKADMLQPGDFVFFRNPHVQNMGYWSDIRASCSNIRDNYKLCDYSKGSISIAGYPISTHVGIYGGDNFVFDQWGSATHGTLSSRTSWAGHISLAIRPNYASLTRK
ncbi:MAG: hypothetical protein HZB65_01300 [Candidatus Aenigmarchaeota archaeon]|nr:hypothetical protein [Candidatus Aenigmarchaeota archaeon]